MLSQAVVIKYSPFAKSWSVYVRPEGSSSFILLFSQKKVKGDSSGLKTLGLLHFRLYTFGLISF